MQDTEQKPIKIENDFNLSDFQQNQIAYSYFVTQSLLSLKSMWFFGRSTASASIAIAKFLHNIQVSNDLSYHFFSDGFISRNPIMAHARIGAANYPYQISQQLFIKILSGDSPFLNFSVVRNPYDRAISAINHIRKEWKIDDTVPLIDILKHFYYKQPDIHFMSLTEILSYKNIKYDFIVRYEDLERDMQILFPQYQEKQGLYARKKGVGNELLANDEFIALVQQFQHDDFDNFGYSHDIREMYDYDNSTIPRSLDKWQNPQNYPCDISILSGANIMDITDDYKRPPEHIGDFICKIINDNYDNITDILQKWNKN